MILDATCGLKEMWYYKNDEETIYLDRRIGYIEFKSHRRKNQNYSHKPIEPTIRADNRFLPFIESCFDIVIYDPPHLIRNSESGILEDLYGVLKPKSYVKDIYQATREISRVLKPKGYLFFKWNNHHRPINKILTIFPKTLKQLFGNKVKSFSKSGKYSSITYIIVFRNEKAA